MPPSLRNRGAAPQPHDDDTDSDPDTTFPMNAHLQGTLRPSASDDEDGIIGEDPSSAGGSEDDEDDEPAHHSSLPTLDPPPPYLRDISTLASWSVSSSKPGCSIPQLRHPSTNLFWQSDGPQPHYLNIHFFKQVKIVGLRMYLDFEQDESYTPTRIVFLAGTGGNDLVEWGEWRGEGPRGWVWVGFGGVDDDEGGSDDDESPGQAIGIDTEGRATTHQQAELSENRPQPHYATPQTHQVTPQINQHTPSLPYPHSTPSIPRPSPRRPFTSLLPPQPAPPAPRTPHMPVLRAHLVQIKILENHQNGKDTHLRGLQIFARNDEGPSGGQRGREDGIREGRKGAKMGRRRDYGEVELDGGELGGDLGGGGIR